jgi:hypothetical protein
MVVSPGSSHSFRLLVVRHDVATVGKFMVADCTFSVLLNDFSVEQLPHLCSRPEFAIPPWVVWIFDALNTKLKSAFFPRLLATAAEQRTVNRAEFIPTEFHGNAPV